MASLEPEQPPAEGMEVAEEPMMPPAKSEPVHVVVTALIQCNEQEELPASLPTHMQEHSPAPAMEVAEGPVMPSAKSELVHMVVTYLIHCYQQEEIPAPMGAPEPKDPAPGIQVPEETVIPNDKSDPVQVLIKSLTHYQAGRATWAFGSPEATEASVAPKHEQTPSPAIRVTEWPQQPPLSGATSLAPEPQLLLSTAPKDGFPPLSFQCL